MCFIFHIYFKKKNHLVLVTSPVAVTKEQLKGERAYFISQLEGIQFAMGVGMATNMVAGLGSISWEDSKHPCEGRRRKLITESNPLTSTYVQYAYVYQYTGMHTQ